MTVRCYRSIIDGQPTISDGADILLDPDGARELGKELLDAADRADRGEFERWNVTTNRWEQDRWEQDQKASPTGQDRRMM